jgi:hypothetical protein
MPGSTEYAETGRVINCPNEACAYGLDMLHPTLDCIVCGGEGWVPVYVEEKKDD